MNIEIAHRKGDGLVDYSQLTFRDLATAVAHLQKRYGENLTARLIVIEKPPTYRRHAVTYKIANRASVTFFAE